MSPHTTQRKEEGVDEREGERETHLNSGAVGAALCCLLKQMHMTSLWHLSMQTKTKLVAATPRHYVGCASLLAFAKITHNKAGKARQGRRICIANQDAIKGNLKCFT